MIDIAKIADLVLLLIGMFFMKDEAYEVSGLLSFLCFGKYGQWGKRDDRWIPKNSDLSKIENSSDG